jgi:hypothetical protein
MNQAEAIHQLHVWGQESERIQQEFHDLNKLLRDKLMTIGGDDLGHYETRPNRHPVVRVQCVGRRKWIAFLRGGEATGDSIETLVEACVPLVAGGFEAARAQLHDMRAMVLAK